MILLINICKERLHYYEFVKPIEDVLKKNKGGFYVKHYLDVSDKDMSKADKVIICGTSLKDNQFLENLSCFRWIENFNKPIFGICGGMQIIGMVFGGKLKKKEEIGFFSESFEKFLGLKGDQEVYHLHNNYVTLPKSFEKFTSSKIPQAVKHKSKKIYGVLFHPEVRQKHLIIDFCKL